MSDARPARSTGDEFEAAAASALTAPYLLRLYTAGPTPQSTRAIVNIRRICEQHLKNRYELEVIDLLQNPELARGEQIIAAPTLTKVSPLPARRFIGDLSNTSRILAGLDLAMFGESPAISQPT